MARLSASSLGTFLSLIGAMVRFSSTVLCGNRLKDWKTMPSSMRTLLMSVSGEVTSWPSTRIVPWSTCSNWLMVRRSVLLPEPEGPMMTTFSLGRMDRETLFRARRLPKSLLTFLMSMMGLMSVIVVEP